MAGRMRITSGLKCAPSWWGPVVSSAVPRISMPRGRQGHGAGQVVDDEGCFGVGLQVAPFPGASHGRAADEQGAVVLQEVPDRVGLGLPGGIDGGQAPQRLPAQVVAFGVGEAGELGELGHDRPFRGSGSRGLAAGGAPPGAVPDRCGPRRCTVRVGQGCQLRAG